MNKEEQKQLLIEIMEADEKDGLYKSMTAVDWYYEQTVIQGKTNYAELLEQAKQMEKEQQLELIQFVRMQDKMGKSIEDLYNQYKHEYGNKS